MQKDTLKWYNEWLDKLSTYSELCFDISAGVDTRILTGFIRPLQERGVKVYYYNNPYKFNFNREKHTEIDGRVADLSEKKKLLKETNSYGFDSLGYVFAKMLDLKECDRPMKRVRGRRRGLLRDDNLYPLYGIDDESRKNYLKFIPEEFRIFPYKSRTEKPPYFIGVYDV